MSDKEQIQAIFLFEFKMGHKAVKPTHYISNAFGPGTADKCTVQWWFKKFCKRDESLEDKEHRGQLSEVDNDKLRTIVKTDPLTTTWEVAEELNVDHSMVMQHLKQIGKVKKLDKWVPQELTESKKNCCCEVLSFFILSNNKQFLYPIVMCDIMWILYDNQLSGWTKKKLQSSSQRQLAPKEKKKKVTVTHGLVVCCPSDPLQFSEFWRTHYIWELCSANWYDAPKTEVPAAAISQQKGPNSSPRQRLTLRPTTNASKIERIQLRSFASSTIFTWLLANWLPLLQASWQLFAGKPAGGRKCFPRVHSVTRVYVPRFFVSSQQRFGATDIKALSASQLLRLGQTVLQLLGKSVLQLYFI